MQKDSDKYQNKEKGAITLFVLITCLFFTFILGLLYISNINKIQMQESNVNQIKDNYSKNIENDIEEIINATKENAKVNPTVEDIIEKPGTYYGKVVTNYMANGATYRIFFVDTTGKYGEKTQYI